MSKAALKKALASMDKEELIHVLLEAYDARKDTKAYFEYWLNPDEAKAYDDALARLDKQFFRASDKPLRKVSAAACSKIIADFASLGVSPARKALLAANYCSILLAWLSTRFHRRSKKDWTARVYLAALKATEQSAVAPNVRKRIASMAAQIESIFPELMPLPRPQTEED